MCRTDETMLPDLLEALIGALYRDQGLAACKRFVRQQIVATTTLDPEVRAPLSRKSALISYVNTRSLGHIAFKTRPTRKVLSNGMNVSTWVTEVRHCFPLCFLKPEKHRLTQMNGLGECMASSISAG